MSKNIEKRFVYNGLGFPIELCNVEIVEFDGERHPKIDVRQIADEAIEVLASQKSRLTGNQVRFVRTYFSMSLREFGKKVVKESHAAVKKWEDAGNKSTSMDRNIEIMLRLYIFDKAVLPKRQSTEFHDQYHALNKIFSQESLKKGSSFVPEVALDLTHRAEKKRAGWDNSDLVSA